MHLKNIFIAALFLICSGSVFNSSFSQNSTAIDGLAQEYVANKRNHALMVGIVQGEESQLFTYGELEKGWGQQPNGETLFEIGGISAAFTAGIMTAMAQKGDFFPDEPIDLYLPADVTAPAYQAQECQIQSDPGHSFSDAKVIAFAPVCYPDPDSPRVYMSLCNLASHNSGIPAMPAGYFAWDPFRKMKQWKDPYKGFPVKKLWSEVDNLYLRRAPGERFEYSELGLAVLGATLARKEKTDYESLLIDRICGPLELKNTLVELNEGQLGQLAPGHNRKGKAAPDWDHGAFVPAAGLHASGADMLKFLEANVAVVPGPLSAALNECHAARFAFKTKKKAPEQFTGYGWIITPAESGDYSVVWISGATGGYRSFIGFDKKSKTGVVLLSNSAQSVTDLGMEMLTRLRK